MSSSSTFYQQEAQANATGVNRPPYDQHGQQSTSSAAPVLPSLVGPTVASSYANHNTSSTLPTAAQSQDRPAPASVPAPAPHLPFGAIPFNGGIWYHSNVFANSYRVPGPNGRDHVYYDNSMPMPPCSQYPTYREQWNSLTALLKVFIIFVVIFWFLHFIASWKVGLCLPILFIWTWILYRQWQKYYQTVELYLMVKVYAMAFVPGALVTMIIETVLTVFFAFVCFQSEIAAFLEKLQKSSSQDPSSGLMPKSSTDDPAGGGSGGGGSNDVPEGMEFLNFGETPQLFIFLFLLSFISAGVVEESLKYYLTTRIRKYRPSYQVLQGYLLYALSAALGFSTIENIGYVLSGAAGGPGGDSSFIGVLLNTLGRTFLSTPLHLLTAYLIGLQVIRRDVLGESLNIVQVMGWSVFFHGCFDFFLFAIMVLSRHWSSGPDDNVISYILMTCVIINCYAGLLYRIWKTRRIVFPSDADGTVEHAVDIDIDIEAPPNQPSTVASSGVGSSSGSSLSVNDESVGLVHGSRGVSSNGFIRLEQQAEV